MTDYKLTYFNITGRAEPVRLLFALADVPYQDIRVSKEEFAKLKPSLPYGQVPVLEFGDTILSQGNAIGRFLARKFGFHGKTDLESAQIDEINDALTDYSTSYWEWYGSTEEGAKEKSTKKFVEVATPKYFTKLSQILETNNAAPSQNENGPFVLVGDTVTLADLVLFNVIEFYEGMTQVQLTKDYPALQKFVKSVGSVPKIQAWIEKRPKSEM